MAPIVTSPVLLEEFRGYLSRGGQKIVATNGCFDVIHRGHIEHLLAASKYGALIIGLNGDESVRQLKGPTRPVQCEMDRAFILSALEFVSGVFIFPEVRATNFLRVLKPDIYVKGGDYSLETMNVEEKLALTECGAEIIFLPRIGEYSTSSILQRV